MEWLSYMSSWAHQVIRPRISHLDSPYVIPPTSVKSLDKHWITFIIPTIHRPTLRRAVRSLFEQTNPLWKAIIVFDGCQPDERVRAELSDVRIRILCIEKKGESNNSAGNVRNEGLALVDTEWVGFLDDDDILSSHYVECLDKERIDNPNVPCILFRMASSASWIVPDMTQPVLRPYNVGISFAYRIELFHQGLHFIPSSMEDYELLSRIHQAGYSIFVSHYLTYFVNGYRLPLSTHYPRLLIKS